MRVVELGDHDHDEALAGRLLHPYQSPAFGAAMRAKGFRTRRYEVGDGALHCLVLIDRRGWASWYYGPTGPIELEAEAVAAISRGLRRDGVRVRYATTQPRYFGDAGSPPPGTAGETPFIDLRGSAGGLPVTDRSVRKNVARAEKAGVRVEFVSDRVAIGAYQRLLREHRSRLGLGMPPFYPDVESIRAFDRPSSGMEVALAWIGGELIAGLGFVRFGDVVAEVAVARGATELPAHDLIKIRASDRYRELGLAVYDLMGVRAAPTTPKEAGIRRYKLKFASRLARYGVIERGPHPLRRALEAVVRTVRR